MTDTELLQRFVDEKVDDAFTELVHRRIDLVYAAALRQLGGDAHRAEDITQHVFITLAQKAGSLVRHPSLLGWLYTSTHYAVLKNRRDEDRRRRREEDADAMQQTMPPVIDWNQLRPVLDDAMHDLPEHDRQVVLLRFFERQSFVFIGAELRLTENAAQKNAERALDRLRTVLARRGITSTSAALAAAFANQAPIVLARDGLAAAVSGAALASLTGGAGALATILQLMSTTKFTLGAAALLALLAIGTAGYQVRHRHRAESALDVAQQAHAAALTNLRETAERAQVAEQTLADLRQKTAQAPAKTPATPVAAKSVAKWDPATEGKSILQRHPEVSAVLRQNYRAEINARMGRFFQRRGLTAEQIEQYQQIMLRRSGYWSTASIDGKQYRLTLDTEGTLPPDEMRNQLRQLLGDDGLAEHDRYASWGHYEAQRAALRLSNALCFTDTPLSPQQADQVIDILHANLHGKMNERETIDWPAIDAKARTLLLPSQLDGWTSVFTETRLLTNQPPRPSPAR